MELIKFFFRLRAGDLTLAMFAGVLSGASNVLFIAVVNSVMRPGISAGIARVLWLVTLGVSAVIGRYVSEIVLMRLSQNVVYDLRMRLSREILMVPVRRLEVLGSHSVFATLTEDVTTLTNLAMNFPNLCVNVAIFISVIGYLFYLAPALAGIVIGVIVAGMTGHSLIRRAGVPHLAKARDAQTDLMKRIRALTDGIKEMKLNQFRRSQFISRLDGTSTTLRREMITGGRSFIAAACWAQFVFFGLLAALVVPGPQWNSYRLVPGLLSGAILALMAIRAPLETIVAMFLNLARAQVSLKKIRQLGLSLAAETELVSPGGIHVVEPACRGTDDFSIEFRHVIHSYSCEDGDNFLLGPLSFSCASGEIVFISGANGSGKTTLIKLLTGLYIPESGSICFNGVPVTGENRDDYRGLFTAVFSDFYLDDTLACAPSPEIDMLATRYLRQFRLDHKVRVSNGTFSTVDLSQGQRKRLALVAAHMEDRSIYVFDEWAADQDVTFRHIFYHQILPDLKRQGKTLFVISHDQNYFDVADRVIVLEEGKLWKDISKEQQVSGVV